MDEYVSREYLLKEYDKQHQGPAGGARKIIEDAPTMVESGPTDTVWLTVPDINVVARVILQELGSVFCKVLYVYESEAAAGHTENLMEHEIMSAPIGAMEGDENGGEQSTQMH